MLTLAVGAALIGPILHAQAADDPATEPADAVVASLPPLPAAFDPWQHSMAPDADAKRTAQADALAKLDAAVAAADTPQAKAVAHLAAANWHLAIPARAAATRCLLGLPAQDDTETLAKAGQAAQLHLKQAEAAIQAGRSNSAPAGDSTDTPEPPAVASSPTTDADATQTAPAAQPEQAVTQPAEPAVSVGTAERIGPAVDRNKVAELTPDWDRLATKLEVLSAFAEVFLAFGTDSADVEAYRAAWSRAARGLAVARESMDAELAAAAMMWQACCWGEAGRWPRAMRVLPEPTKPLDGRQDEQYGFISRLLRCRFLADQGQPTAAAALSLRVAKACPDWFESQADTEGRTRARLARVLHAAILERWAEQLRNQQQTEWAADLSTLAIRVVTDQRPGDASADPDQPRENTGGEPIPVYHLPEAIPLWVTLPDPSR